MRRAALAALWLVPAVLGADEVILKNGGRIEGVVVAQTQTLLTLDVGPGRLSLPLSRVASVERRVSALAEFRERAATLEVGGGAMDWLALAQWAGRRGLLTQAREAYARTLALDPQNAAAHAELGHVLHAGQWLSVEDSYRARGYVRFEGEWVTPDELRAREQARATAEAARSARVEAEVRLREAEARQAEAEAQQARAAAAAAETAWGGGIPLWWGGGGWPVRGSGHPPRAPGASCDPPRPVPPRQVAPPAPPRTPPRDVQASVAGPPRRGSRAALRP